MSEQLVQARIVGIFGAFFWVVSEQFDGRLLAKAGGKLRVKHKKGQPGERLLAVGDQVRIQILDQESTSTDEIQAYIEEIEDRHNSFRRAAYTKVQTIAANVDHVVIITSLKQPWFSSGFLDRVLVESELNQLPVTIVVNKIDLLDKKEERMQKTIEQIDYYEKLGYSIYRESLLKKPSKKLQKVLQNGLFLLIGQSGVGKSTLLNQVAGQEIQKVGALTSANKGKHTTTNPVAYFLNHETALIDVPGVKEFGLQHRVKEEIGAAFREFENGCRFDNCLHQEEPGCQVKEAIDKSVASFRYNSYINIVNSLTEKFKQRKGNFWRDARS